MAGPDFKIDQKETKALADILALIVDDNENVARAALAKLRQRAHSDGVTGGALKNLFNAMAGRPAMVPPPPRPAMPPTTGNAERDLASARETIGELTVRTMELSQQLSASRAYAAGLVADIVSVRGAQAEANTALRRQAAGQHRAWAGGAVAGCVLGGLLMAVGLRSLPVMPVAWQPAPAPAPTVALSAEPVPLAPAGAQFGPVALNMNWSNATPDGTRWRVLPSSMASGYSLVVDLGDGQAATVGVPASFMQTSEAARNQSVQALRAGFAHPPARPAADPPR